MAFRKPEQDKKSSIPLSDFIRTLREELKKARDDGQGEDLRFEVGQIEVELAVEAHRKTDAGGGVQIYVLEAGAHEKMANVSTQRVKLSLNASVPASHPLDSGRPAPDPDDPSGGGMSLPNTWDYTSLIPPWSTSTFAQHKVSAGDGSGHIVTVTPETPGRQALTLEIPGLITWLQENPGAVQGLKVTEDDA
jgi:hypothetical protein